LLKLGWIFLLEPAAGFWQPLRSMPTECELPSTVCSVSRAGSLASPICSGSEGDESPDMWSIASSDQQDHSDIVAVEHDLEFGHTEMVAAERGDSDGAWGPSRPPAAFAAPAVRARVALTPLATLLHCLKKSVSVSGALDCSPGDGPPWSPSSSLVGGMASPMDTPRGLERASASGHLASASCALGRAAADDGCDAGCGGGGGGGGGSSGSTTTPGSGSAATGSGSSSDEIQRLSYRQIWYAPRLDEEVLLAGLVQKRSRHLWEWRERWAALTNESLCFFAEKGSIQGVPTEYVKLSDVAGVALQDDNLTVRLPHFHCLLRFSEVPVAERWAECLLDAVNRCTGGAAS